jgi:gluconate 2-dehydrogenase gamma chain
MPPDSCTVVLDGMQKEHKGKQRGKSASLGRPDSHPHSAPAAWLFFNQSQAAIVESAAARIIPGDEADPGAREAGAVRYIDRALAGAYADHQGAYRRGTRDLDSYAKLQFGTGFIELTVAHQDRILQDMEQGKASGFTSPTPLEFFNLLHQHTIEGMFSDPVYGGNRDAVGWKLIGFPGAQYGYSAEEMKATADLSRKRIVTLEAL